MAFSKGIWAVRNLNKFERQFYAGLAGVHSAVYINGGKVDNSFRDNYFKMSVSSVE